MARLLWISNGAAEDQIAARICAALGPRLPRWEVAALPLVGRGEAFEPLGLEMLGPRRVLPSGGLTLHHPRLLRDDLRAGLVGVLREQLAAVRSERCDAAVVVGDIFAQAMAALLPGRPQRLVYQSLVSVRMGSRASPWRPARAFREGILGPERRLMRSAAAVYTRDGATAEALRAQRVAAQFLGNPMMDGLEAEPLDPREPFGDAPAEATLLLLPGSRGYAARALQRMVATLEALALREGASTRRLRFVLPWRGAGEPRLPAPWEPLGGRGPWTWWRRGGWSLGWAQGRFGEALASADAALGATGTAQEQAVGRGLPVVAFPVPPDISRAFLENQQRLLGAALEVVDGDPEALARALERALFDPRRRAEAARLGPERMGPPGGSEALAADIARRLEGG